MLTAERQAQIRASAIDGTPKTRLSDVSSLQSPEELQYYAIVYNWDDGFEVPFAIANHPRCDLAVALELFWLTEAQCLYIGEIQPDEWNADWVALCRLLTDGIIAGKYVAGEATFRSGLGVARIYQYKKKGLPAIFLTDVQRTR